MTSAPIKWPKPNTRSRRTFLRRVRGLHQALTAGLPVVAVDPALGRAESRAALVVLAGGKVIEQISLGARGAVSTESALSGLLRQVQEACQLLEARHPGLFRAGVILVIEELRGGMVPAHLHWAAGILVAGITSSLRVVRMIELPICYWKAHAAQDPTYTTKTDIADATQIGRTIYALARDLAGTNQQLRTKRASKRRKRSKRRPA